MRILLIEHPRNIAPDRCNDIANTPLSSCLVSGYAAGMLKHCGHEVGIIEGYLERLSHEEISARAASWKPDIVGVHMVYHWNTDDELFSFLDRLKKEGLAPYITAYGFYATVACRKILAGCSAIDSIIMGETEAVFPGLAAALSSGKSSMQVQGLALRDGSGGTIYEKAKPADDLDALPFPVRTDALYRLSEVNLLGSRGCYGRCTFCYINTFFGEAAPWRGRSPENIASEIDAIIKESGKRDFYFTDPNFFGPGKTGQQRALKIAALLKPMHIRFGIEGRVNDIRDRTIAALVDAGLRHILIGLESGRDESLRRMNKMTTVSQNEEALRILRRHGIEPNVGFIMFEPDSSLADIRTNFEFLKRNDLLKNLPVTANVLYHHQIVLEGTQTYQSLGNEARLEVRSTGYEGVTPFRNQEVAALAKIMRETTNYLFQRMDGIWSGALLDMPGAEKRYAEVNSLLVDTFGQVLLSLENGSTPGAGDVQSVITAVQKKTDDILCSAGAGKTP